MTPESPSREANDSSRHERRASSLDLVVDPALERMLRVDAQPAASDLCRVHPGQIRPHLLIHAADFTPGDDPEDKLDKLEALLERVEGWSSERASLIVALLGIPPCDQGRITLYPVGPS